MSAVWHGGYRSPLTNKKRSARPSPTRFSSTHHAPAFHSHHAPAVYPLTTHPLFIHTPRTRCLSTHHAPADSSGINAVGVLFRDAPAGGATVQVDGLACSGVSSDRDRGSCLDFVDTGASGTVSVTVTNSTMERCQGSCIYADIDGDYTGRVILLAACLDRALCNATQQPTDCLRSYHRFFPSSTIPHPP